MQSVTPDSVEGEDHIEHLFRCYSPDGEKFMTAVESNRGSGGYLEYLMRYVSSLTADKESDGMNEEEEHQQKELPYHVGRNTDIAEVNQHGLKFAKIYGFRNIQSLMLKLKRGKCDYDFVEVMACPSGCLNGGGQLRTSGVESPEDIRQRVAALRNSHGRGRWWTPDDSPWPNGLCERNLSMPLSDAARRVLHTRYHHVPGQRLAPLSATW